MADLRTERDRIIHNSVAPSTRKTYDTALASFKLFCNNQNLTSIFPASIETITLYIAHLSLGKKSASTIETYLSAIGFHHKLQGYKDPTNNFTVTKMKEGCKRRKSGKDARLPITSNILRNIIPALQIITANQYEATVFKAVYLTAFTAFMRVSELTVDSKHKSYDPNRTLMLDDLTLLSDSLCEIRLKTTKTNQHGPPIYLQLTAYSVNTDLCPVKAMQQYITCRSTNHGPLFVHFDGSPITRYQFASILQKAISYLSIPEMKRYKNHGFRIGACSSAAMNQVPDVEIKEMGRWSQKSTSYKRYIRIPTHKLHTPSQCS